jgi:phosphomannomutase
MSADSLESVLAYEPTPLRFGTSGRRGNVVDLAQLEVYIVALAELEYLQNLPIEDGGITRGDPFYFAFDLRPSSSRFDASCEGRGEIAQAVVEAIRDAGMRPVNLGTIPTPAVAHCAMQAKRGCMMVTGSHIPFERNGYKTYTARRELLKRDEAPIERRTAEVRSRIGSQRFDDSPFDQRGMFKWGHRDLPEIQSAGAREYVRRYLDFFETGVLRGCRVLVYQHSAVGRDLLVEILDGLGCEAIPAGRSDTFVPIDTENIDEAQIDCIQSLVDEAARKSGAFDAVVSTDGDSDRPLLLGIDPAVGQVQFFGGDLLGMVVADFLGADAVVVPISCNDAIDRSSLRDRLEPKTRIGSPYVIAGMEAAIAKGKSAVCGWEANGGFLLGSNLERPGRRLSALPTRDAVLPLLCALCSARSKRVTVPALFGRLPPRYSRASLLKRFPREISTQIVQRLQPENSHLQQADFLPALTVVDAGGYGRDATPAEHEELARIRERLCRHFAASRRFGDIKSVNWIDGVRVTFDNGEIAHVRPSGNADEFRIYAVADSQRRADEIARAGVEDPGGILRNMERQIVAETAAAACLSNPGIIEIEGAVRPYEWGGYAFIPSLLGRPNPDRKPFAELWLGAHPTAPAVAVVGDRRVPLDNLFAEAPEVLLGTTAISRFGAQLPYLFKVLDARAMLSIQAHPNKRQAEDGFARENAAGLLLTDPLRNYRDDNHKPEVHVALTEFWMLHGFRPLEEIADALKGVPELRALMPEFSARFASTCRSVSARPDLLKQLYATAITLPQERVDALLRPLIARLEREAVTDKHNPDYWALRAAREFPLPGGHLDRGIFSIYLLNLLRLSPGEGTYQPAGSLHAYLEGANVELMANSDNVLRGGLTPKHVDTAELLGILTFAEGAPQILRGDPVSTTETVYRTPAKEFELSRIELPGGVVHATGADHGTDTLIALEGSATATSGRSTTMLAKGKSGLVPANVAYRLLGDAEGSVVFRATVPPA